MNAINRRPVKLNNHVYLCTVGKYALLKIIDTNHMLGMEGSHTILNKKCFRRVNQCIVCVKKELYKYIC